MKEKTKEKLIYACYLGAIAFAAASVTWLSFVMIAWINGTVH